jgi:hypothetical protein
VAKKRTAYESDLTDDANIFSFVIRIWREEITSDKGQTIWRGHITPIPNGKRHYFSDIQDIPAYMTAHLKEQH